MTAAIVAIVASLGLATAGVVKGTWAAGGSDSSCYALMAESFARGSLQPASPLAPSAPWPNARLTLAPAGFIPSPVHPDAASPICAPGFSLLLAPLRWLMGPNGVFLATPLAGALLVWFTFVFARRIAGPLAGACAAVLVATMPVVLFQAVQPMNDITTAMLWMAVLAAATLRETRRPWVMGAATGLALLVRPNLAPAAVAVGLWMLWDTRLLRSRVLDAARLTIAAVPAVAVMLWLNAQLYGDPFRVGYGSASDLFSAGHVATNLRHYGAALLQTTLGIPLFGVAAPIVCRGERRRLAWLGVAVAAATIAVYLVYRPFDEWWYLRFLLPAIVALTALAGAVSVAAVDRLIASPPVRAAVIVAFTVVSGAAFVAIAAERQAFDLQRLEARFHRTGQLVRDRLPTNAVLISVWESGTVRFHAGREAVLWDSLDPDWLDRAVEWLDARGYQTYVVIERWEEPVFRERFASRSALGMLDWPPRFEVDRQVRIYDPADRARYMRGESVPTEQMLRR